MCKNELGNSKNSNLPTIVYTIATIINRTQRLIFNNCRGTIKVAIVAIVSYRASLHERVGEMKSQEVQKGIFLFVCLFVCLFVF